jgi:arylformamidase
VPEYRAHFDADIQFVNGGGMTASGFRLDLPADLDPAAAIPAVVGRLFVHHLGLALVGAVAITGLAIVEEQHRGSRGIPQGAATNGDRPGTLVDLSHTIRDGLVTYPGLPAPVIVPHLTRADSRGRYAPGTEFAMDTIRMLGNTGTYLDSPFHRYEGGTDLAGLELDTLVDQPAEVFHLAEASDRGIRATVFYDRDLAGRAVLLHTGWDRHFGTPSYATGAPFLDGEASAYLVDQGVTMVGIDSLNIDDTESGGERPAHTLLLRAGIHVVEHLTNLGRLPATGAQVSAVPPRVEGLGTFPVRAYARLT